MSDSQKWLTLVLVVAFGALIYLLAPILMPFVIGFLLAYLGNPVVDRLVTWRIPRSVAVLIVFIAITLVFAALIGILVPEIRDQIVYLNTKMPDFITWIKNVALPWIQQTFQINLGRLDISELNEVIANSWQEAGAMAGQVISKIATSGLSVLATLGALALIPVVTFYLMLDWKKLVDATFELFPRHLVDTVKRLAGECDEVLSAFFRGQFMVMILLSIIYTVGLKIAGLDVAVIVGMTAGLGSIIPYFGFTIGIVIGTIAAIFQFQELVPVLWVWAAFAVGQTAENWVLIPYLVGNKVGLHPVAVIFAILAGGQLFGFFGMLLAIPAASVIVVLMRDLRRRYFNSELYK